MTAQPTQSSPRSRRALLAGALGGVGAIAAGALGRQQPARAAVGDPVIIGALNFGAGTSIESNDVDREALILQGGTVGLSAFGRAGGVRTHSAGGYGVYGTSENHYGVRAESDNRHALLAQSFGTDPDNSRGAWGHSKYGQAVYGDSELGWAGYFDGRVFVNRYLDIAEGPTPANPRANRARLFVREAPNHDTQLCVRFPNGNVRILATA